ncbi:hypothetical protein SH467x_001024 [Pirellulaceae bacterium SH467]|jgi:hypothetical protein
MKTFVFWLPTFAILGFISGCGSRNPELTISGHVTINGEPIEGGSITFVAEDGVAATGGGTIQNGKYTAIVMPGRKKVLVLGNKLVGEEPEYQGVPDSPMRQVFKTVTPETYNAAHLTPLTATIDKSEENLDFALTGDPPKPQK